MEKYTRGRGISYPILSLEKAIEAVQKIDSEYQKAAIDREAAAVLLGFSGLTGSSGRTLGALGSYGLTDRSGPGKITVSELARSIIYPVDAKERVISIKTAITNPPLFEDISDQFEGSDKPSENGVKIYLRRKGMPPKAVSKAVESYMDSINYVISEEMNAAYKTSPDPSAEVSDDSLSPGDSPAAAASAAPATDAKKDEPEFLLWIQVRGARGLLINVMANRDLAKNDIDNLVLMLEAQKTVLEED